MRRRQWARTGARVRAGGLLAVLALLLTGCSAHDWERNLRFGFPTGVTKQAGEIRVLYTWSGVTALILGIIVWGLIFWCCLRYRKHNDDLPRQTKYNFAIEVICVAVPFLIIAGLFYRTYVVEENVNELSAKPDVRVQVDGFKWNWQFEYHSYADAAGKTHNTVYPGERDLADNTGNTLDKQRSEKPQTCDEAASIGSYVCGASGRKDDAASGPLYASTVGSPAEVPVLVVPVHRSVRVVEHSEDVNHSFWVPEFLFKRDVIPFGTTSTARDNQFEFTALHTGSFTGFCSELCGVYHYQMRFEVRVVPEQTFEKYVSALVKIGSTDPARQAKALAAAGMPAYATTTSPLETDRRASTPTRRQEAAK